MNLSPQLLAFYLPQYHPTKENNEWWGKGFTDWDNVKKARPLFKGHYQPHQPRELGYYDLRNEEIRCAQALLAKQHGIGGFCYFHYWFLGKRLLHEPLAALLKSKKPDFPFCLCWANENWTRAWDGKKKQILMKQEYSDEDDSVHIQWLSNIFHDERYLKIEGKPILLIYHADHLPNVAKTISLWRKETKRSGFPGLYLIKVESFSYSKRDPMQQGFDATVEFQPDWFSLEPLRAQSQWQNLFERLRYFTGMERTNRFYDYEKVVNQMLQKPWPTHPFFPCVTPSWDNTARRKKGATLFTGSTPKLYEYWLKETIGKMMQQKSGEKLIFINAWNEWAEGNHLEPCEKWGLSYLKATQNALTGINL